MQLIKHPLRAVLRKYLGDGDQPPLLEAANFLFGGDLAIVGTPKYEDSNVILATIAVEQSTHRDILIIAEDIQNVECLLLSSATDISVEKIKSSRLSKSERELLRETTEKMSKLRIDFLQSKSDAINGANLKRWLTAHPDGLALLMAAWPASLVSESDQANEFVRMLKEVAMSTDSTIVLPWWVPSHPDLSLTLQNLRGAGAAEEDTDLVILARHDFLGTVDEIRVAKNRHGSCDLLWPRSLEHNIAGLVESSSR